MSIPQINEFLDTILPSSTILDSKTSEAIRKLEEFLKAGNYITEKGAKHANYYNCLNGKSYYIEDLVHCDFAHHIHECILEGKTIHYTERQYNDNITHSGIMIDIDRYQLADVRQITRDHLKSVIKLFVKLVNMYVDFEDVDFKTTAVVIAKHNVMEVKDKNRLEVLYANYADTRGKKNI